MITKASKFKNSIYLHTPPNKRKQCKEKGKHTITLYKRGQNIQTYSHLWIFVTVYGCVYVIVFVVYVIVCLHNREMCFSVLRSNKKAYLLCAPLQIYFLKTKNILPNVSCVCIAAFKSRLSVYQLCRVVPLCVCVYLYSHLRLTVFLMPAVLLYPGLLQISIIRQHHVINTLLWGNYFCVLFHPHNIINTNKRTHVWENTDCGYCNLFRKLTWLDDYASRWSGQI